MQTNTFSQSRCRCIANKQTIQTKTLAPEAEHCKLTQYRATDSSYCDENLPILQMNRNTGKRENVSRQKRGGITN